MLPYKNLTEELPFCKTWADEETAFKASPQQAFRVLIDKAEVYQF